MLVIVGGAAHSNTQGKRDEPRVNFLDYRENTEGEGGEGRQKT